jgi:hypothetical protein
VLVSGFSQGGPATMMVGRALQRGQDPYFRLAYDNALYCQSHLRSRGATQTLTDAGDVDHNQTVRKALPLVISGFTQ